jgi:hypothetical protein
MRALRKHSLVIFCDSDPLPPKGEITENQQDKKSPLGDLGVRNTCQSGLMNRISLNLFFSLLLILFHVALLSIVNHYFEEYY